MINGFHGKKRLLLDGVMDKGADFGVWEQMTNGVLLYAQQTKIHEASKNGFLG